MSVPLLDLQRIHAPIEQELQAAFARVLNQNNYILGAEVTAFESACAEVLAVKHAIGVSSGSDALLLALMCIGIGPGDEVICPTYTFFATAGAIARLGATPVFVDLDPSNYNWKLEQVFAARTERTRAVIPVHLFGSCADMSELMPWAEKYGITVIEDAAQAIDASWREQPAGSIGHFGCFSFFPSKNLGGFGDGGLLTTQDDQLAEKARILRAHGAKPKYHHHFVGGNFRLDALQAALLHIKLQHLDSYTWQRQDCAARYRTLLAEKGLAHLAPEEMPGHVYNQFILRLACAEQRHQVQDKLTAAKIGTAIYYPIPLHLQACFSGLGYKPGDLPEAEAAAQTTLAIPIFPGLTEQEQDAVVSEIKQAILEN
ncbi:MAG: DegT/DnrJ/EryC1/StrS family aminotransferase [Candidatus Sericytochromatia bacterium]|nr:DegT/DnrJ/EryC1/StrS family aminotransferase [Candidatus Sericytochromatia bacterium]